MGHSDFRADPWGTAVSHRAIRRNGHFRHDGGSAASGRPGARHPQHGQGHRSASAAVLIAPATPCCSPGCMSPRSIRSCPPLAAADSLLPRREADQYVAEQARGGCTARGARSSSCRTPSARSTSTTAPSVGAERRARRRVRWPDSSSTRRCPARWTLLTPARPAWYGVGALAFAMLPRWTRRLYGLPGLPTTDLSATIAARSAAHGADDPAEAIPRGASLTRRPGTARPQRSTTLLPLGSRGMADDVALVVDLHQVTRRLHPARRGLVGFRRSHHHSRAPPITSTPEDDDRAVRRRSDRPPAPGLALSCRSPGPSSDRARAIRAGVTSPVFGSDAWAVARSSASWPGMVVLAP